LTLLDILMRYILMGVLMKYSILGFFAALVVSAFGMTTQAQAFCSAAWADVTILCPQPVPYPGPKKLTDTSRNMPTVGTPGLYHNWGSGYDVRGYLDSHGTGYQPFWWEQK